MVVVFFFAHLLLLWYALCVTDALVILFPLASSDLGHECFHSGAKEFVT